MASPTITNVFAISLADYLRPWTSRGLPRPKFVRHKENYDIWVTRRMEISYWEAIRRSALTMGDDPTAGLGQQIFEGAGCGVLTPRPVPSAEK
jgi:hypothetical protein